MLLATAAMTFLAALAAIPAFAGNTGGVSVSLNAAPPAVKSITVGPTSTSYGNCFSNVFLGGNSVPTGSQLNFPNGGCSTPSVTVTNGNTPAAISVAGADMVPADNATHWALCTFGGTTSACTGPQFISGPNGPMRYPGTDEYYETISSSSGLNLGSNSTQGTLQALSNTAAADSLFGPTGGASANQQKSEFLAVTGPSQSSDSSTSWGTTVTWTAS